MQKLILLIISALLTFATVNSSIAHEFSVGLIIPVDEASGKQFLNGFMLATAERDSHADEVSDGHLGGLDVYVIKFNTVQMNASTFGENLKKSVDDNEIAILAYFDPNSITNKLNETISKLPVALLAPGITPFSNGQNSRVTAFRNNYKKRFGILPTTHSAQGYNTARRIDFAVRPLDNAHDANLLIESFRNTKNNFDW